MQTLVDAGVEVCFANPGTSEIHLVAALDAETSLRPVLCLHEGIATGAADGYGRMARKPAVTLLHLGPGLANGLANLHNAQRARTPIVNLVGGHATFHDRYAHSPLASDIEAFAKPVSGWLARTASSTNAAGDAAKAVEAALRPPGQVATLIVPADVAWSEADRRASPLPRQAMATADSAAIYQVASELRRGRKTAILIRGDALQERGLTAAGRIAAKTGARLLYDTIMPRIQRGAGRVKAERIPYFPEAAADFLRGTELLILVGANPPVSVFATPQENSWLTPAGCNVICLAREYEDGVSAMEAVAQALGAPPEPSGLTELALPALPRGAGLDAITVAQTVAHHLPDEAIIVDETNSSGQNLHTIMATARPHDHLTLAGGAIGWALAAATGAAIACPGRKTICLHGDGGASMAQQALWTQARENLDLVTVIFSNRAYAILKIEMGRAGFDDGSPVAQSLFDLRRPTLNWVKLAEAMGVEGSRAHTVDQFSDQFASAVRAKSPRLIEAVI